MLERLSISAPNAESVFSGIKELVRIQGGPILENLVPHLTQDPLSLTKARTLSSLASVAGDYLAPHLNQVLRALFIVTEREGNEDIQVKQMLVELFSSISQGCVDCFVEYVLYYLTTSRSTYATAQIAQAFSAFVESKSIDYSKHIDSIFQTFIPMFIQVKDSVHICSWNVINTMCTAYAVESLSEHIIVIRDCVKELSFDRFYNRRRDSIAAFSLKNGIQPFIPIYQHCLMHGSQEARECAAHSIGELVNLTDLDSLKPYVIKITGPLIRIVGDRFHEGIKSAILNTLTIILKKSGILLKPFVPQLQTTFVKALQDPSSIVREAASDGLGKLMVLNIKKASSLIDELISGIPDLDPQFSISAIKAVIAILNACGLDVVNEIPDLKARLSQLVINISSSDDATLVEVSHGLKNALKN